VAPADRAPPRRRGTDGTDPRRRGTDGTGSKPSTGCSTPERPRQIAPPHAAVKQTAQGDKPSTGCSTPVWPRQIVPPRAAVEQTALTRAAVKQTALGANQAPAVPRRCGPGRSRRPAPPWNRRHWEQTKHRLFYAGAAPADRATPRRRGTDGTGSKPSTVCSTPVRPRQIVPPRVAAEQTALGDKPSTVCSTPVRPRQIVPPRAAVEQTALGANQAPAVLRRCGLGRSRRPRHRETDGTGRQTKHRLFYAGAASAGRAAHATVKQTARGGKPSTGCSTPERPRQVAPPHAAVKQTAQGDKPSTGCSTPVRPRQVAPPHATVKQTAQGANQAPAVLRRCGPGRSRCPVPP